MRPMLTCMSKRQLQSVQNKRTPDMGQSLQLQSFTNSNRFRRLQLGYKILSKLVQRLIYSSSESGPPSTMSGKSSSASLSASFETKSSGLGSGTSPAVALIISSSEVAST
jgi:hypothetical protein